MTSNENDENLKMPLPIVQGTDEEAGNATFGEGQGPTPYTPVGAAMLWWMSLGNADLEDTLHNMSLNPAVWGDFKDPLERIGQRSIAGQPIWCEDDVNIAYVKFIDYGGETSGMAFEAAPLDDVEILTMVKDPQGDAWFVWGLSHNHIPPADQVYGRGDFA